MINRKNVFVCVFKNVVLDYVLHILKLKVLV
jgi:hypothetical protein